MPRLSPALGSALALTAWLAPGPSAHDSVDFMRHREAPFAAPLVITGDASPYGASAYAGTPGPFASSGVTLLGWVPLSGFAGGQITGADCWGYTSPTGREYAIIGMSDGVGFVEVSDPGRPVVLATLPAVSSLWRDMKTYQDHAYHVSEGGDGIQIVDMSQIDNGLVIPLGSVNAAGTTASHNVAINEASGFLYQIGGGTGTVEGLRIYSLADPSNPVFVGEWDDRYIHDAQIVSYTSGPFAGREVAFCFSETSSGGGSPAVDILDVTDKGDIFTISQVTYDSPVFSHQGWLSPDRQHLYLNDELDESTFGTDTTTRILNVSNLNAPFQQGSFTSGLPAIDHNLYTEGDLILEANYRSGLRVFDASNPTSPSETAFFDTYAPDDGPAFNGLWSVFPYFGSETIIGSDLEKGLFVWRLGPPELTLGLPSLPELVSPNGQALEVAISAAPGKALDLSTPTLWLDTGSGFVASPLTAVGAGMFQANLPAVPCATSLRFYFTARTTEGVTYQLPAGAPTAVFGATAATSETIVLTQDLETNPGWTVGAPGDDATTGIWTRVDPIGTAAQPEDDHTAAGTDCFVTGQGVFGGSLGDDDVDGGRTTLLTDVFDLSGGDASIRYWRWYSNVAGSAPGTDVFEIDISNDGGSSWVQVETVGPSGDGTMGGWIEHSFVVSELLAPTSQMRMRFVASDLGDGSIVEAGIDDFEVVRFDCSQVCQTDLGFGGPGNASLSICGDALETGKQATLTLEQTAPNALAVLFLSLSQTPVPFKGGTLVTLPILLDIALQTNGAGAIAFPVPGGNGPLSVFAQFAIADGSQPQGVALSNALRVDFEP